MKKLLITLGFVSGTALFLMLIIPFFFPWSGINCRHEDINIKTGQARYIRILLFIKISEEIKDTALSIALQGETVEAAEIKPWQRVNTFTPGISYSPHYSFHSALHQVNELKMLWDLFEPDPEQRKETAKEILTAWQLSGGDHGADDLIRNLSNNVDLFFDSLINQ